jgi:hypothetical protein
MVPLAMLFTFVTGLVGFVLPALATLMGVVAYGFLAYIILLASWFANLPFASFVVPAFPFPIMVLAYIGIGYALYRFHIYQMQREPSIDYSPIAGWTIVDEATLKLQLKQKERPDGERSLGDNNHAPIFFR